MKYSLLNETGLSYERLNSFLVVVESGSISGAAGGDPSRQSLMSRQIGELESFFGVELTRRRGRGIEVTPAGRELAAILRLQFQELADFKIRQRRGVPDVRVAAGGSVLRWLVIPAWEGAGDLRGKCHLILRSMRSEEIARGLVEHELDFGIVRRSAVSRPLSGRPLMRMGYELRVPVRWRLSDAKRILEEQPWALTSGGEFRANLEAAAGRAGIRLRPTIECASFADAEELVRRGVAASVLPDIAPDTPGVRVVELPWFRRYAREMWLCWHPRNLGTRPFLEEVREWFAAELGRVLASRR